MAIKPESPKQYDKVVEILDDLDKGQAKIAPKLKDFDAKVRADAKLDEPKLGEVHKAALGKLLNEIDTARVTVQGAKVTIKWLLDDEDYLDENLAKVEALKKRQEEMSELLLAQYKQAKELENLAEENMAKDEADADGMFEQLAIFETNTASFKKRAKEVQDEVGKLNNDAFLALTNRDAAALATAQKQVAAVDLSDFESFTEYQKQSGTYLKQQADATGDKDAKAKAQLKDSVDDLNEAGREIDAILRVIEANRDMIKKLKLTPVDVAKALKTLGLPNTAKDKLSKIFKGPSVDYEKGLAALAKELKLKETGKELLAKLEKAKIV